MATPHDESDWPALPFQEWADTAATLHMWTQIIGKIRMQFTPWTNHSWHVTLYLTSRGLTTSPIPHGTRTFEIRLDFIDHTLRILASDGAQRSLELKPRSVAKFYRDLTAALSEIEIPVQINLVPNEIADPIPFDRDEQHRAYDRGICQPLLARAPAGRSRLQGISRRLLRQMQPGPFFLG